jgi:hypothetical protein
MFLEMRVPSAAGILKVRSDKHKVCLFLYLLWSGHDPLKITKKKKTVDFDYNINGQTLETVASNPYLGAELTNTMSWDKQVQKVVAKGNKAAGILKVRSDKCKVCLFLYLLWT